MFTMGSLFPPLTSAGEWGRHTMRIFGHLGIAFVIAFAASTDGYHSGRNGCSSTGRNAIAVAADAKYRG
jgi:hypothetical protein